METDPQTLDATTDAGSSDPYTDQNGQGTYDTSYQTDTAQADSSDAIAGGKGFYDHFKDCMSGAGLPAPDSLFSTAATAIATVKAIQAAVATYGTEVTIAELIGAGVLSDALAVAGALTASFYVGACVGCLIAAGIDSIF